MSQLFSVEGKVAVVTGAGRGLGYEYAKTLLKEGAKVCICDVNVQSIQQAKKELNGFGELNSYIVNVASEQEVIEFARNIFDKYGRIDILVNNAGVVQRKSIEDMDEKEWNRVMDINVKGTFLCSKYLGNYMKGTGGKIVNISSISGRKGLDLRLAYCTSKASIEHFTRTLAREWGPYNIQVNAIGPGYIKTKMNEDLRNNKVIYQSMLESIPLGRFGEPIDLVGTLLFLVSQASDYVTGQTIFVDGGVLCN